MATSKSEQNRPQPQTPANPEGEPISNSFENGQSSVSDAEPSGEALDKEQQFKEAQTERD